MTWVQENALTYNNTQYGFKIENSVLVCYAGGQDLWRISLADLLQNPVLAALTTGVSLQFGLWQDQKASGTAGGDFTSGAWQTRTLNTEVVNTITGASLAANAATLSAGSYLLVAVAPAYNVNAHQLRIWDGSAAVGLGPTCNALNGAASVQNLAVAFAVVSPASPTAYTVEHRCATTHTTNGYGQAGSLGTEVYANLFAMKLVTT